MNNLEQHKLNFDPKKTVKVDSYIDDDTLHIFFEVITPHIVTSDRFNKRNWSNWELWEYDVVEAFLSRDSRENKYLELQMSPLGQKLALIITTPRKKYDLIPDFQAIANVEMTKHGFNASFAVPINLIPGDDNLMRGNYCACLGHGESQSFFSLVKHEYPKPDFHVPARFKELHNL